MVGARPDGGCGSLLLLPRLRLLFREVFRRRVPRVHCRPDLSFLMVGLLSACVWRVAAPWAPVQGGYHWRRARTRLWGLGDILLKSSGMTRRFPETARPVSGHTVRPASLRVFNRGHFAATSEEWNPSCPRRPRFHGFILRPGARNLFEHTFGHGSIVADAQVVVVVVGSMDCRVPKGHPGRTLDYTVKHVTALVDELRARGKLVILCELRDSRWPGDRAEQVGFIGTHHRKNTALGVRQQKSRGRRRRRGGQLHPCGLLQAPPFGWGTLCVFRL